MDIEYNVKTLVKTKLVVDRDKPVNSVLDLVCLRVTNWTSHNHLYLDSLEVSLIMFYLNLVDFCMIFLSLAPQE